VTPFAITGVGLVNPLGVGYPEFVRELESWANAPRDLFAGHDTLLDPTKVEAPMAAECLSFDAKQYLGDKGLRNHDRLTKLLLVCGKLTLEDAGLKEAGKHRLSPERIGVCSATAYGSLEAVTEAVQITELEDPRFLNPNRFPNTVMNSSAAYVSIWEDLRAPNVTVVDGNCGSLDAVLSAETHLLNERADVFLVGGGEALTEALYVAFRKLNVLADRTRTFAPGLAHSQGMRLGEGAAYLSIEKAAFARSRGARVRAEVIGYGNAFDAPESEARLVHVSSDALTRAIKMALRDADLSADQIDVVASGLCGVADFDGRELAGILDVPNLRSDLAVAAPKVIYGETFGAGGVLASACALAWFDGVPVAPLVQGQVNGPIRHVLVTAVGYYGNASALILRRADGSRSE
jgi:3-oxoacyl-(acyl-carrier-protein) synthase